MKKTLIYSLVVAAFLVGCGDKDGASITDGVKNVAAGAVEKSKEVAGDAASSAAEAVKEGGDVAGAAKDAVTEAASSAVDTAKEAAGTVVDKASDAAGAAGDVVKDAGNAVVEKAGDVATGAVDAVKDAGSAVAEKAGEVTDGATAAVVGAATAATDAVSEGAEKVAKTASAGDSVAGVAAYTKCKACHGANGEKKALGASQIIAGWDAAKIVDAMNGYKDGSYGGKMKGVMKGQVATMSDEDIANVAAYIATLK